MFRNFPRRNTPVRTTRDIQPRRARPTCTTGYLIGCGLQRHDVAGQPDDLFASDWRNTLEYPREAIEVEQAQSTRSYALLERQP